MGNLDNTNNYNLLMAKSRFNASSLIFIIIFFALTGKGQVFASSLTWTCPVCEEEFKFDSRDVAYRNSFARQHLAMHQSAQSAGHNASSMPGFGSTGDPVFDAFFPFMQQTFKFVGEEFSKNIFGPTPAQQQAINAEMENLRSQQAAAALEEQRLKNERYKKLLGSMKRLPGTDTALVLKTIDDSSRELKMKDISSIPIKESASVIDNLVHAAFFMKKAAATNSPQEADFYAEQAFLAADGGNFYFDVPSVGHSSAVPITEKDVDDYGKLKLQADAARKKYTEISGSLAVKHNQVDAIKKARDAIENKVKQQEEKTKTLPRESSANDKDEEENKLAEARKLLEEAKDYEAKAEKDLKALQNEADKISSEVSQKRQQQQQFLNDLGSRK